MRNKSIERINAWALANSDDPVSTIWMGIAAAETAHTDLCCDDNHWAWVGGSTKFACCGKDIKKVLDNVGQWILRSRNFRQWEKHDRRTG